MPGPLPRSSSAFWWNRSWRYRVFLLREFSALFAAAYMVLLLVLAQEVRAGEGAFEDYLEVLQGPVLLVFHAVALLFAILHTVTWFQAVPKALPLKIGGRRVPGMQLIAANYVALAAASVVVAVIFLA
jgi:fumarate reductase subunit C